MQYLYEFWSSFALTRTGVATIIVLATLLMGLLILAVVAANNIYQEAKGLRVKLSFLESQFKQDKKVYVHKLENKDAEIQALTQAKVSCLNTRETMQKELAQVQQLSKTHKDRKQELERELILVKESTGVKDESINRLSQELTLVEDALSVKSKNLTLVQSFLSFTSSVILEAMHKSKTVDFQTVMISVDKSGNLVHLNLQNTIDSILSSKPNLLSLTGNIAKDFTPEEWSQIYDEGVSSLSKRYELKIPYTTIVASVISIRTLNLKYILLETETNEQRLGVSGDSIVDYLRSNVSRTLDNFIVVQPFQTHLIGLTSNVEYVSKLLAENWK